MHLLRDSGSQAEVSFGKTKCRKSFATARTIGTETRGWKTSFSTWLLSSEIFRSFNQSNSIINRTSSNFNFRSTSGPREIRTFWISWWKQLKSLISCRNSMRRSDLGRSISSQKCRKAFWHRLLFRLRSCIICQKMNRRLRISRQINMSWIRRFGNLKYVLVLWAIGSFLWAAAGRPRMFATRWILTPLSAAEATTSSSRHFRQKVQWTTTRPLKKP